LHLAEITNGNAEEKKQLQIFSFEKTFGATELEDGVK